MPNLFPSALVYTRMGYRCLPIMPNTKRPAINWKHLQPPSAPPNVRQITNWFTDSSNNVAIITGEIVVLDCDAPEIVDAVQQHCGRTPMISQTPSGGFHCYYRARKGVELGNKVNVRGIPLDVRASGGYVVAPPSVLSNGAGYSWVGDVLPVEKLPVFKVGWIRQRRRHYVKKIEPPNGNERAVRARCYVSNIEGAIAGRRGHDATFRVACVLIHKFGLSIEQAMPILQEWNETCEPPWSEKELLHKLQDAVTKGKAPK